MWRVNNPLLQLFLLEALRVCLFVAEVFKLTNFLRVLLLGHNGAKPLMFWLVLHVGTFPFRVIAFGTFLNPNSASFDVLEIRTDFFGLRNTVLPLRSSEFIY